MDLGKWVNNCDRLSNKLTRNNKYGKRVSLYVNFSETKQKADIEVNSSVLGNDFYRTKDNLKADLNNPDSLVRATTEQFDMPLWASDTLGLPLYKTNMSFIAQLKGCNIHCPWCFVDDKSKNCKKGDGEYFGIPTIANALEDARATHDSPIHMIRLSGGEPTLVPWQWTEMLSELDKRGLSKNVYFQGETNLTTGHFMEKLQGQGRLDKNFFEKVGEHNNFGLLASFKGTDTKGHLDAIGFTNPKYSFLEEERWHTAKKMVEAGINLMPFVYDPNPETLPGFIDKGVKIFGENFALKAWPFALKLYGPEKDRLEAKGINHEIFQKRLSENFKQSEDIMNDLVAKIHPGETYKGRSRVKIPLEVQPDAEKFLDMKIK